MGTLMEDAANKINIQVIREWILKKHSKNVELAERLGELEDEVLADLLKDLIEKINRQEKIIETLVEEHKNLTDAMNDLKLDDDKSKS